MKRVFAVALLVSVSVIVSVGMLAITEPTITEITVKLSPEVFAGIGFGGIEVRVELKHSSIIEQPTFNAGDVVWVSLYDSAGELLYSEQTKVSSPRSSVYTHIRYYDIGLYPENLPREGKVVVSCRLKVKPWLIEKAVTFNFEQQLGEAE